MTIDTAYLKVKKDEPATFVVVNEDGDFSVNIVVHREGDNGYVIYVESQFPQHQYISVFQTTPQESDVNL